MVEELTKKLCFVRDDILKDGPNLLFCLVLTCLLQTQTVIARSSLNISLMDGCTDVDLYPITRAPPNTIIMIPFGDVRLIARELPSLITRCL